MNIALLIGALIVSFLIFTWLVKVVKATVGTAITVAFIILVLQIVFGVGPNDLLQQLNDWWQDLRRSLPGQ